MKFLYTNNATREYKAGRDFFKFKSVQSLSGWIGVLKIGSDIAEKLLEHEHVIEVDEAFYEDILKKKNLNQNPNRKEILTSADPTKPVTAEEKSVESVEVDLSEIEVTEAEVAEVEVVDSPKPKRSRKKK